jgi:hypothetical protein
MLGFFSDRAEVGITPFSLGHGSALMAAFEPEAGRPGCRLAIALVLGAFGTALAQGGGGGGGRRRRGRRRGWGRSRCNRRGIERRRPNWRECGSNGIRVRIEAVSPGTTGAGPKNQGGSGATGTGTDIDKSPSRKAVTTFTAIRTRFNATRVRSSLGGAFPAQPACLRYRFTATSPKIPSADGWYRRQSGSRKGNVEYPR